MKKRVLLLLSVLAAAQLQAAMTFTQLAAATADTSNTTSYAGNAGTPNAGDLLICFVWATATTGGNTDGGTMTGTWTWTQLTNFKYNGGLLTVFYAYATAATSTTPTFDCTGDAATGASIYCLRVTGGEGQVIPSARQICTGTASAANPQVSMFRNGDTTSGWVAVISNATPSSTQFTAPSGWTEDAEVTFSTPSSGFEVAHRASGETGASITWTNSNTTAWGAIVIELWVSHVRANAVQYY